MGEKENKPFQLTFNGFLKVDFQGSRVRASDGFAKAQTRSFRSSICGNRSTAASQARSQRCRASLRRSDLSLARLEKELGSRRGAYVASAASRQSCWPVKRTCLG